MPQEIKKSWGMPQENAKKRGMPQKNEKSRGVELYPVFWTHKNVGAYFLDTLKNDIYLRYR